MLALKQEQEPSEENSRKIWLLLQMGFNPDLLRAGIDRLRDMKHSTMTTEQAHAAGAVYLKLHRTYGDATMRTRSFAYQMEPLLAKDPVRAKVQALQRQLGKVKKQNPNKIGVFQAFVGEMENLAKRQKQAGVAKCRPMTSPSRL